MMPLFGLSESTISQIHSILRKYTTIENAVIYGSRAKGTYREGSDIDLTLFGDVDLRTVAAVLDDLNNSFLPYTFDISSYILLKNESLREHIDRVGMVFYTKEEKNRSAVIS